MMSRRMLVMVALVTITSITVLARIQEWFLVSLSLSISNMFFFISAYRGAKKKPKKEIKLRTLIVSEVFIIIAIAIIGGIQEIGFQIMILVMLVASAIMGLITLIIEIRPEISKQRLAEELISKQAEETEEIISRQVEEAPATMPPNDLLESLRL